jgi:hypothetical protein
VAVSRLQLVPVPANNSLHGTRHEHLWFAALGAISMARPWFISRHEPMVCFRREAARVIVVPCVASLRVASSSKSVARISVRRDGFSLAERRKAGSRRCG